VENATSGGKNSTKVRVAGTTESDEFSTNPTFLGIKFESDKVSIEDVGRWSCRQVEGSTGKLEGDIPEAERSGFRRADSVFSWAQEKKEAQRDHVTNSVVAHVGGGVGNCKGLGEDRDWNGFDTGGRRVFFGIGAILALEPEVDVVVGIKAGVWGPHTAERLRNRAYGVFHCARADRLAAGFKGAVTVTVGEYLK
jgi:hypothetical protein